MYPAWQLAKFTSEATVATFLNMPQGFESVGGLSYTDYAFTNGRYEYNEAAKRFYMDTKWNLSDYHFDLERPYLSGDYELYGPRSLICTSDYIVSDFSTAAVYFNLNMEGRYVADDPPSSLRSGDNYGGNTDYTPPVSSWSVFEMRAYLFDPSLGFEHLGTYAGRKAPAFTAPLAIKKFGTGYTVEEFTDTGILGTAGKEYDPGDTADDDVGSVGYRLNISPKVGASIISNSSTGLGLQLTGISDVNGGDDRFSPNIEIIGIRLGDVLLGMDHNGETSSFWQDFHKTAEIEV